MHKKGTLHITTFPDAVKQEEVRHIDFAQDDGTEKLVVNLYPQVKYQEFEGFGGAFTDSAGYVYSKMSKEQQDYMLNAYYGEDGLGYNIGRLHFDSCDFSLKHYEAVSDKNDTDLSTFTLEDSHKHMIPLVTDAQKVFGGEIPMMAAPWSPPAFMKTSNERNFGGKLLPEYRELYADYLCKYIEEMRKAGVNLVRLTTQNEPIAVQTWDSCIYTGPEEKEFIRDFLYPALQKHNLEDVELFVWDHNKERVFERACETIDEETDHMIAGIAFHWYSGDHFEALDLVKEKFPDKKMVQSEACIEYQHFDPTDFLSNAQKYAHDIIGDLNGGMTGFYDWNLVLDQEGGPNHVKNFCDAPFLYNLETGELEERASYSYIGHFSKFIKQGAKRIGYSRYTQDIQVTAFENPNGEISAVFLNTQKEDIPVSIRVQGAISHIELPAESITTLTL